MKYRKTRDGQLYMLFKEMDMVGEYDMPKVQATPNAKIFNLLSYNYAKTCPLPQLFHLCFYIDDYQFERIWREPQKALELLKRYKGIIGPDFSLYRDMPTILNIYNCWRNKVLMAYFQSNGIEVIPNVSWADKSSYSWCFDGLPKHSVLAVSTNGCIRDKTARRLFAQGYKEMLRRLEPTQVILVGPMLEELQNEQNIIRFEAYSGMFKPEEKQIEFSKIINKGGP